MFGYFWGNFILDWFRFCVVMGRLGFGVFCGFCVEGYGLWFVVVFRILGFWVMGRVGIDCVVFRVCVCL